jgi:O-antigen/teichoic acid export membrane protein
MTTVTVPQPAASTGAIPHDLGHRAGRGFVWQVGFTIGAKVFSTIGQIALAWFLVPNDFGLVAMTWTVLALAGLVQNIGVQDVLVQRHAHLRRWANPGFWMALSASILAMVMANAAIPLALRLYDEPKLAGMIAVLSLSLPLRALLVLPRARLSSSLRFRTDATIMGAAAIATMFVSIVLAAAGCGAYSMIVSVPLVLAVQVIVVWFVAPVHIKGRPQLRRWRFLLGDTGYSWGVMALIAVILQAGYIVLSLFGSTDALGLYFIAFNLSTQVFTLLIGNLMVVLLPSLSLLGRDPQRQTRAFLEATRLVMAVGLPACLLLAAVADPMVSVLYRDEYAGLAPLLAALAIGMSLYLPAGPSLSMMKAQGRFRTVFLTFAVNAALLITLLVWAAISSSEQDAATWVAIITAAVYGLFGPVFLAVALWGRAPLTGSLGRVYAAPLLASVVSIGAGLLVAMAIPERPWSDVARLCAIPVVTAPLYGLLLRSLDGALWSSLLARLRMTQLGWNAGRAQPGEPIPGDGA